MSGWEHILANDGVSIAIGGMTIVFSVLALISGFIFVLPKALDLLHELVPADDHYSAAPSETSPSASQDEEIAAAIGFAMQLELRKSK